jgi:putative ABC transport system permease protein
VPRSVVAGHVTNPLVDSILVRGGRAADLERFAARRPGMEVLSASELRSREDEDRKLNAYANYLLVGMLIVFTAIAVVNTLVMSTADRVREFALLRLSGATRRQVLRMVRGEALLVAAVAAALGSAIAAVTLVPFSVGMTDSAMPYVPPLWYGAVLAGAALLALAASLIPARLALRTRPVEGIGIRE